MSPANQSAEKIEASILALRRSRSSPRFLSSTQKNDQLNRLADALENGSAQILEANQLDLRALRNETPPAFRDRLTLNSERIHAMAVSLRQVAALPDPVGEVVEERHLTNGLKLRRVRAPLGLILMIFESRPNVIVEAFSLAYKSGNIIILRGGSESAHSAAALYQIMESVVGADSFLGIEDYDRAHVEGLLRRPDLVDVVVPRGGDKLISFVQRTALMPIIKNDRGLCHAYVDDDADLPMAVSVVANAKVQRPGVCNSLETVLVHRAVATEFLPKLYEATNSSGLRWYGDARTVEILSGRVRVEAASADAWNTEYLDLILNCRVVEDLEQALHHIAAHGSKHSESILTRSETKARRFQNEIDAAVVYWNASTRFTDGFEFGLGGELGISTQKLHVRGPVGLRELTTPRWLADGSGQIR